MNILFDQLDPRVTAITALTIEHKVLNLGREFHYAGIQLLPGVWQGDPDEIKRDLVNQPYTGKLALIEINKEVSRKPNFLEKQNTFIKAIEYFIEKN